MKAVVKAVELGARGAWRWRNKLRFRRAAGSGSLPRLLVDVSEITLHDAQTGIQRVVRSVWSELAKRSGEEFVAQPVYATRRHGYCYAPADFLERRSQQLGQEPVSLGAGDKFLGLDLSAHLLPKYRDQLRDWRQQGGSVHVVVYDLLPLLHPEWFTKAASVHFRKWIEVLMNEVDEAICISDDVAQKLATMCRGADHLAISRLHMGADIAASRPSSGICDEVLSTAERMARNPTILMVGTVEPRKGYPVALDAFEYLWRSREDIAPSLVIVGKVGWKTNALQSRLLSHPELGGRLRWLDRVSDEGLQLLYERSRGILVTSYAEGFGLPLMEAAAHGRAVLARDIPVFREQALPNVRYFRDEAPSHLAADLMELVRTGGQRPLLRKLRSWSQSVDRLVADLGMASGRFAA